MKKMEFEQVADVWKEKRWWKDRKPAHHEQ